MTCSIYYNVIIKNYKRFYNDFTRLLIFTSTRKCLLCTADICCGFQIIIDIRQQYNTRYTYMCCIHVHVEGQRINYINYNTYRVANLR